MLYVTKHATERFIERVLKIKNYSIKEVIKTRKKLNYLFKDVVVTKSKVIVPGFSKYIAVIKGNRVVTILNKN